MEKSEIFKKIRGNFNLGLLNYGKTKELYYKTIRDSLKSKFDLSNIFEVPKIEKIVINMGVGETVTDSKLINSAIEGCHS